MPEVRTLTAAVNALREGCTELSIVSYNYAVYPYEDFQRAFAQFGHKLATLRINKRVIVESFDKSVLHDMQMWCMNLQELELRNMLFSVMDMWNLTWAIRAATNLKRLSIPNNGIGYQAIGIIAPSLATCSQLEHLDLSNNGIGANSIKKLMVYVSELPNFVSLDMSCNLLSHLGLHALKLMLEKCPQITDLYVGGQIGAQNASEVDEFMAACKNLRVLRLGREFFKTDEHTDAVAKNIRNMRELRKLHIDNMYGSTFTNIESVGDALVFCEHLRELTLNGCFMSSVRAQTLAQRLQSVNMANSRNGTAMISYNTLELNIAHSFANMQELSALIPKCTNLRSLDISANIIGAVSAKDVFQALAEANRLEILRLSDTRLFTDGGNELAKLLPKLQLLHTLDISYCRFTWKCGLRILKAMETLRELKVVNLSGMPITAKLHIPLAKMIANNKQLTKLSMHNCNMHDVACNIVSKALDQCANLEVLSLTGNYIGNDGYIALSWALRNATKLQLFEVNVFNMNEDCAMAFFQYFPIPGNPYRVEFGTHFQITDPLTTHMVKGIMKRGSLGALLLRASMTSEKHIREMTTMLPFMHPESEVLFFANTMANLTIWSRAHTEAPMRRLMIAFFEGSLAAASASSRAHRFAQQDGDNAMMRRILAWLVG